MKISSYGLLVRIAKTRLIRSVTQAGPGWDLISFAVANVIQRLVISMITRLSTENNRKELALERKVVQPTCSNSSKQNQSSNNMRSLSDD
jgi:hypothetical protein